MNNAFQSFSRDSWDIVDENTAIKHCDKSFFEDFGSAIPMDTVEFWNAENLSSGQRREIVISYQGVDYAGCFRRDYHGRTQLKWLSDLKSRLSAFAPLRPRPLARFQR